MLEKSNEINIFYRLSLIDNLFGESVNLKAIL